MRPNVGAASVLLVINTTFRVCTHRRQRGRGVAVATVLSEGKVGGAHQEGRSPVATVLSEGKVGRKEQVGEGRHRVSDSVGSRDEWK